MALRKGQKLFNGIARNHILAREYTNLHKILFYMSDEEFDEIMDSDPK